MRILRLFVLFAAVALNAAEVGPTYVPASPTAVTTSNTRLNNFLFTNVTAGAITVTVKDASTNCNAAACEIISAVSIAAHTTYQGDLGGVLAVGGFTWTASGANSIVGYVNYGK